MLGEVLRELDRVEFAKPLRANRWGPWRGADGGCGAVPPSAIGAGAEPLSR